jgi:PAS domain S-box-containing protein
MDQMIANLVSLGLLVFLFGAITRRAPDDDRLRCWVAGWVAILIHIGLKFWTPISPIGRLTNLYLSLAALGLTAIFFVISTMIVREGRRAGLRLGSLLAFITLPLLAMAVVRPHPGWIFAILVIARQGVAVWLAMRTRINRSAVASVVLPAIGVSLAWMLYGIAHGHSEYVVIALLAEMYVVAGADFWFNGWERTMGLVTTCLGLFAFGGIFPGARLIQQVWPRSQASSGLFGISAFCVAIGMILIVLEEDARSARGTTEEYRLTFDTNPHPLWVLDKETLEFLSVNQAACVTHGYTREEFASLKLPDILEKKPHRKSSRMSVARLRTRTARRVTSEKTAAKFRWISPRTTSYFAEDRRALYWAST